MCRRTTLVVWSSSSSECLFLLSSLQVTPFQQDAGGQWQHQRSASSIWALSRSTEDRNHLLLLRIMAPLGPVRQYLPGESRAATRSERSLASAFPTRPCTSDLFIGRLHMAMALMEPFARPTKDTPLPRIRSTRSSLLSMSCEALSQLLRSRRTQRCRMFLAESPSCSSQRPCMPLGGCE